MCVPAQLLRALGLPANTKQPSGNISSTIQVRAANCLPSSSSAVISSYASSFVIANCSGLSASSITIASAWYSFAQSARSPPLPSCISTAYTDSFASCIAFTAFAVAALPALSQSSATTMPPAQTRASSASRLAVGARSPPPARVIAGMPKCWATTVLASPLQYTSGCLVARAILIASGSLYQHEVNPFSFVYVSPSR